MFESYTFGWPDRVFVAIANQTDPYSANDPMYLVTGVHKCGGTTKNVSAWLSKK